jgi:hypothetical protein
MTILATACWKRLDLPGHDAACLRGTDDGFELSGRAVFLDPRGPAALRYELALAPDWSTRRGHIGGFIGRRPIDTRIAREPEGWTLDGRGFGMAEIVDLDLGFTPATNMVQLRRAGLKLGETAEFDVAWLEAGDEALIRLPQVYRRDSDVDYAYDSPTANYSATIVLARSGFAAVYPGLWEIEA